MNVKKTSVQVNFDTKKKEEILVRTLKEKDETSVLTTAKEIITENHEALDELAK